MKTRVIGNCAASPEVIDLLMSDEDEVSENENKDDETVSVVNQIDKNNCEYKKSKKNQHSNGLKSNDSIADNNADCTPSDFKSNANRSTKSQPRRRGGGYHLRPGEKLIDVADCFSSSDDSDEENGKCLKKEEKKLKVHKDNIYQAIVLHPQPPPPAGAAPGDMIYIQWFIQGNKEWIPKANIVNNADLPGITKCSETQSIAPNRTRRVRTPIKRYMPEYLPLMALERAQQRKMKEKKKRKFKQENLERKEDGCANVETSENPKNIHAGVESEASNDYALDCFEDNQKERAKKPYATNIDVSPISEPKPPPYNRAEKHEQLINSGKLSLLERLMRKKAAARKQQEELKQAILLKKGQYLDSNQSHSTSSLSKHSHRQTLPDEGKMEGAKLNSSPMKLSSTNSLQRLSSSALSPKEPTETRKAGASHLSASVPPLKSNQPTSNEDGAQNVKKRRGKELNHQYPKRKRQITDHYWPENPKLLAKEHADQERWEEKEKKALLKNKMEGVDGGNRGLNQGVQRESPKPNETIHNVLNSFEGRENCTLTHQRDSIGKKKSINSVQAPSLCPLSSITASSKQSGSHTSKKNNSQNGGKVHEIEARDNNSQQDTSRLATEKAVEEQEKEKEKITESNPRDPQSRSDPSNESVQDESQNQMEVLHHRPNVMDVQTQCGQKKESNKKNSKRIFPNQNPSIAEEYSSHSEKGRGTSVIDVEFSNNYKHFLSETANPVGVPKSNHFVPSKLKSASIMTHSHSEAGQIGSINRKREGVTNLIPSASLKSAHAKRIAIANLSSGVSPKISVRTLPLSEPLAQLDFGVHDSGDDLHNQDIAPEKEQHETAKDKDPSSEFKDKGGTCTTALKMNTKENNICHEIRPQNPNASFQRNQKCVCAMQRAPIRHIVCDHSIASSISMDTAIASATSAGASAQVLLDSNETTFNNPSIRDKCVVCESHARLIEIMKNTKQLFTKLQKESNQSSTQGAMKCLVVMNKLVDVLGKDVSSGIFFHGCEKSKDFNAFLTIVDLIKILKSFHLAAKHQRLDALKTKSSIFGKDGFITNMMCILTYEVVYSRMYYISLDGFDYCHTLGISFGLHALRNMLRAIYSDLSGRVGIDSPLESQLSCIKRCQKTKRKLNCKNCGIRFHKNCNVRVTSSKGGCNCCPTCQATKSLVEAVQINNLPEVYSLLVEKGASPLQPVSLPGSTSDTETAIHAAVRTNNYDVLSMLLFGSFLLLNCDDSLSGWGYPPSIWGENAQQQTPFESGIDLLLNKLDKRPPTEALFLLIARGAAKSPADIQKALKKRQRMKCVRDGVRIAHYSFPKDDFSLGSEPHQIEIIGNGADYEQFSQFKLDSFLYVTRAIETRSTAIRWFDCRCGKGKQLRSFEGNCTKDNCKILHRNHNLKPSWKSYCNYLCASKRPSSNGTSKICPCKLVQAGVRYKLEIFWTNDGRGWGVRTAKGTFLKKNEILFHYAGEIITLGEVKKREEKCNALNVSSYIMGMDEKGEYFVDGTSMGSLSSFLNHSCSEANVEVFRALGNHLDANFPFLAFKAREDIADMTELTFNYFKGMGKQIRQKPTCLCSECNGTHCLCKHCKEIEHNKQMYITL